MKAKLKELLKRLRRIDDLESAASLLAWDQRSYMPAGGATARARQISTLKRLAHEQFASPAVGRLLDSLRSYQDSRPYDQEMNRYCGRIGGLHQHFTLGNIMSALWFELATQAHPEATAEMSQGEFGSLRTWLVKNIHTHGRKFTIPELVKRVAGELLTPDAYLRYLRTEYGKLCRIRFT